MLLIIHHVIYKIAAYFSKLLINYLCNSMKQLFTFFLLLVSLTATFYPCCDRDSCNTDEPVSENNPKHNNHKSEGTCSPFITCGTCPGFVNEFKPIEVPFLVKENIVHTIHPASIILSAYNASLLQPPQMA